MSEREQKIRELIERVSRPDSGVSPEFSILNVDDAQFLLAELTACHERLRVIVTAVAAGGEWLTERGAI